MTIHPHRLRRAAALVACVLVTIACDRTQQESSSSAASRAEGGVGASASASGREQPIAGASSPNASGEELTLLQDTDKATLLRLHERWTGDFDWKGERRFIRALVPFSRTYCYLDGPRQAGLAVEALTEFEKTLREKAPKGTVAPKVVIVPTSRAEMLTALSGGLGDIAIGGFAVTRGTADVVDFSVPTKSDIKDLVVTGPASTAALKTVEDLAGQSVHVRKSSSYAIELRELSARLTKAGKRPIDIVNADERLEDEDLLQMVDAGIVPITVVKDIYATFWSQLYDRLTVRSDLVLNDNVQTAWAFRRNTPNLQKIVNEFLTGHRAGTTFGNVLLKKYLGSPVRLKNPAAEKELQKFRGITDSLRKYARQYDFDWLLIAAQGYQESQLDQTRRSAAGAVGIMQIKPETAADANIGIRNIDQPDNNIHAGVKYLRFMVDRYFKDAPMERLDKGLFALASYNAGPARVARLRQTAQASGLDPNRWFYNVEIVASREIGRETVDYVSNIFKYYTAYKVVVERQSARPAAAIGTR
jgi:membrane-bound lytic murein transglycosylase MltF